MTNGIFTDDAKRDEIIVRTEERLMVLQNSVDELRQDLHAFCERITQKVDALENENAQNRTWVKILGGVFSAIAIYLFQKQLR